MIDAMTKGLVALWKPFGLLHQVGVGLRDLETALALLPAGSPVAVGIRANQKRLCERVQLTDQG